ncbi:MAG: hypothetical protein H7A46_03800 [Verrucomicrobiales bacterium]|nr:hypothetical protein [Verrucomicrobiales bacterium]
MPVKHAKLVYEYSLVSMMAHTIRAVQTYFRRKGVLLDVFIEPDISDRIKLCAPGKGATSMLSTRFFPALPTNLPPRVTARIFIHRHANNHLARICIAHEVYHLLLELDHYLANGGHRMGKSAWPKAGQVKGGKRAVKEIEDKCNQFAWQLCKHHDKFNRDDQHRGEMIYFPEEVFLEPLKTNDAGMIVNWPKGVKLDEEMPFWKPRARVV